MAVQIDDEVGRAMQRNGVVRESSLEMLTRQNAYYLGVLDPTMENEKIDEKLDKFIASHRANPDYASSFAEPVQPKGEKPKPIDPMNLSPDQLAAIADGRLRVG